MKKCGIQFINVGPINPPNSLGVYYFRHRLFYDFLVTNRKNISRVIVIDLFDAAFQRDPFTTYFKNNKVYFNSEIVTIEKNFIFNRIIRESIPIVKQMLPHLSDKIKSHQSMLQFPLINGGFQSGGIE